MYLLEKLHAKNLSFPQTLDLEKQAEQLRNRNLKGNVLQRYIKKNKSFTPIDVLEKRVEDGMRTNGDKAWIGQWAAKNRSCPRSEMLRGRCVKGKQEQTPNFFSKVTAKNHSFPVASDLEKRAESLRQRRGEKSCQDDDPLDYE